MAIKNEIELIDYNGIQIYDSDIDMLCDEYINTLNNPELIYKATVFTGLLDYIYKHLVKNILSPIRQKNDYKLLDNVFRNIYLPLCYKYNIAPTILSFSCFIHVPNSYLSDLNKGVYRAHGEKVNPETNQIVKEWFDTCENGLLNKAISESSIGSIFALKALYSYSDSQTININTNTDIQHETAEQIAARHSDAQLPEKIEL